MARKPLRPLIRSGGFYPSRKWTPLVYAGGYTTANGGEEPAPPPIEKTIIGNPIHILDALAKPVQSLSVKLEPIQDLHGYDNPWLAGGGKNKLHVIATTTTIKGVTFTVNSDGTIETSGISNDTIYFDLGGTLDFPSDNYVLSGCASGGGADFNLYVLPSYATDRDAGIAFTSKVIGVRIYVANGVNMNGKIFKPMLCLASATNPYTFAPYSNICPISGHTDADVTRTGVNVWDEVTESGVYDTTTGNPTSNASYLRSKNGISCVGNTQYYATFPSGKTITILFYDGDTYLGFATRKQYASSTAFTTPENANVMKFYISITTYNNNISINYPSTDHDYHAYVGTTYPIPLGQTVYGGTLDVTTGVLTVDRWSYVFDGTQTGAMSTSPSYPHLYTVGLLPYTGVQQPLGQNYCSHYKPLAGNFNESCFYLQTPVGQRRVSFNDIRFTTAEEYRNYFVAQYAAGTPVTVCYKLATPQTYQLTPTEVTLLLGENNLFSEGEMTLVYLADGNASDVEALNILLGGRYVNNHGEDEPSDREALDIVLGGKK